MAAKFSDTHGVAEAVQVELLSQASVEQRLAMCCSLTQEAIHQSRRALAQANPNLTQPELDLLFVRTHYGAELADELQRYLEFCGR